MRGRFHRVTGWLARIAAMALSLHAAGVGAQDTRPDTFRKPDPARDGIEEPEWREEGRDLPDFPREEDLVEVDVLGGDGYRYAVDPASIVMLSRHRSLFGLSGVVFLSQLAHVVLPAVFVLYAAYRYQWSAGDVGMVLALVGICSAIVQAGLMRHLVRALGERRTLLLGLGAGAIGFAIYGTAASGTVFLIGIPVMALWGIANPSAQALMTAQVDPTEQGRLQGAIWSLAGVAGMVGPYLFTQVFALFIGDGAPLELPGAPFLLSASLLAAAGVLAWAVAGALHQDSRSPA